MLEFSSRFWMVGGGCWLPEGPAGLLLVVAVGPAAVAGAFWDRDFSMTLLKIKIEK